MMLVEDSSKPADYLITRDKLDELKGNIPRAGPRYRLGMYFETIHNLHSFDSVLNREDGGYTSYWETDTEVDSDLGNFIFNNVGGDSASLICFEDTLDILALRNGQQEHLPTRKPHYKLEHDPTLPLSPSDDRPLERSIESKESSHSRRSHPSCSDGMYDNPPPVPPPRQTTNTNEDFEDHIYESLDDCKDGYLVQRDVIYISKGSEGSQGSQGSMAKPASNEDMESDQHSSGREATSGKPKPRSMSLQQPKTRDNSVNYRQRRKMSDPSSSRKRRSEKVASKGSGYPAPVKGFPSNLTKECADYSSPNGSCSPDRYPTSGSGSGSPVGLPHPTMCHREVPGSPRRKTVADSPKYSTLQHTIAQPKKPPSSSHAPPLVIKHKGKTYFVPVVDQKLEKELERRSKINNPTVSIKHQALNSIIPRLNGRSGGNGDAGHTHRSHASPPKTEAGDYAASHKRKQQSSFKPPPHTANGKQVTHYGVF